ncbi:MAG: TIGR02221 family CRISPR-associated protein [candidate division KSB1 bacterium]|nr:TIGR02221 family CRISPR-associated protein [candidate division KSB1 bacterium]
MKLITFLGTNRYDQVTYTWGQKEHTTNLFPEALAHWLQPQEMLVALTAEARASANWAELQRRLAGKVSLNALDIPTGRSEQELWEIFDVLTARFGPGDEIAFDITHAFRSLPVLSLLAAAYLQAAKGVRLCHLLYGCYEARQDGRAPVFDLTPFLELLQWLAAADLFQHSGDARRLAPLVKQAHRRPWSSGLATQEDLPRHLESVAACLDALSRALLLARPRDVAPAAQGLAQRLSQVEREANLWARPFAVLLAAVSATYAPFARDTLAMQRDLVQWFVERGHVFQAVTLAREWLVSWACVQLGKDCIADRSVVEATLNSLSRRAPESKAPELLVQALKSLPSAKKLCAAWSAVAELRNDIAHCGFRKSPRSMSAIARHAAKLPQRLQDLPLPEEPAQ